MRLLLTSAGLINTEVSELLLKELSKPTEQSRVLVIAYSQNPQEEFYVNESKKELEQLGFKYIDIVNMHNTIDLNLLKKPDAIYICGGNTYSVLDMLHKTGLSNYIIENVNESAIYIGVSAGSIIAGPNIEIAGWGSEGDKNEVGLQDLTGLNFVNIAVFPHFHDELQSEVDDFRKKVNYQVIELTNNQALFIKDKEVRLIGSK